jgi:hypothetical protein
MDPGNAPAAPPAASAAPALPVASLSVVVSAPSAVLVVLSLEAAVSDPVPLDQGQGEYSPCFPFFLLPFPC